MLRKGRWNGRQLIPADWVEESTRPVTSFPQGGGYGYMWWDITKWYAIKQVTEICSINLIV